MKVSISILLLVVLALPILLKFGIYIDFKIHQESISKELCILKEVPNNCCQGKCQLTKRLKKVEEPKNKELPKEILIQLKIETYIQEEVIEVKNGITNSIQYNKFYFFEYKSPNIIGIKPPPKYRQHI